MENVSVALASDADHAEISAVCEVLSYYAEGLGKGDIDLLKKAFHPQALMSGYFGGELMLVPIDGLYELVRTHPSPAETGEPYAYEISNIQIIGETATGQIAETSYLGHNITDRFHLVKIEGRWQIVSKIFSVTGVAVPE
jgi:hypothetical protein